MENKRKAGLYIHVPFCSKKCNYCDFYSLAGSSEAMDGYTRALISQLHEKAELYKDILFDTVYIGGGTPTSLGADKLCRILDEVKRCFSLENGAELTIEANPGVGDAETFSAVREHGATRLSLGLQSANDDELKLLGRIHTCDDFLRAYESARDAGFDNISTDIMFSLPFQTIEMLERTLNFVLECAPEHISTYSLKLEPGTPFYRSRDKLVLPSEDEDTDMYLAICEKLTHGGYEHYEISNFAKSGHESRHNTHYWNCDEYLGLGPAAHSYIDGMRYGYSRDLRAYMNVYLGHTASEDSIICEKCIIDARDKKEEALMLGLRLARGVSRELLCEFAPPQKLDLALAPLYGAGLIRKTDIGIALTDRGMYVSNSVITYISELGE